MKKNKLFLSILTLPIIALPIIPLVACNDNTTYNINWDIDQNIKIEGKSIEELPKTIKSGQDIYYAYTIQNNKFIDESICKITVNGESIINKRGVEITDKYIKIAGKWITGNLEIKLVAVDKFNITNSSVGITFDNLPNNILQGHDINTTYTFTDTEEEKCISYSLSDITIGGTSVKGHKDVKYADGTLFIPKEIINGAIHITLTARDTTIKLSVDHEAGGYITGPTQIPLPDETKWENIKSRLIVTANKGYTFAGWYIEDKIIEDTTLINQTTTIKAKFNKGEPIECNFSFDKTEGGNINKSSLKSSVGLTWGEVEEKPTAKPESGYDFVGWFNGNSQINDDTVITGDMTLTATFSKDITPDPGEPSTSSKRFYYYYQDPDTKECSYEDTWATMDITTFNSDPCGYVNINSWFGQSYKVETQDGVTTMTNKISGAKCIIDSKHQLLVFDNYEQFCSRTTAYNPMARGVSGGEKYFNKIITKDYKPGKSLIVDLNKYNIKTYCYNNQAYLPYEIIRNVFGSMPYISWLSESIWDYNGAGFYEICPSRSSVALTFKKLVKSAASNNFYNAEYMEYCYNLLALTLDMRYGMTERESRDNLGTTIKYLEKDVYTILQPYHDGLVSLDNDTSAKTLRKAIAENFDDGGHTGYVNYNALSSSGDEEPYFSGEGIYSRNNKKRLTTARTNSKNDVAYYWDVEKGQGEGWTADQKITGYYKQYEQPGKDTIAYLTFDKFESQTSWNKEEQAAKRELPSGTTDINYGKDTLRLTMWANQQIKKNNIKNLVIDISCNGGGTVYTEHFIASWLCGGVTEKIYNPKTNSYCEYTVQADINGDGKFNSDDYISEDVNLYVITSSSSFSCGNMLPCNIQDCRPNNTIFMGHRSGGGACFVDSYLLTGANSFYQFSSSNHMLRNDSTESYHHSVDSGNTITTDWEFDELNKPEEFFDRTDINNRIWNK